VPPNPLMVDRLSPFIMSPPPPPPPPDLMLPITSDATRPPYLNVVISEDNVKTISDMGFAEDLARFALKFCDNDLEVAVDQLLNHMDEVQLNNLRSSVWFLNLEQR